MKVTYREMAILKKLDSHPDKDKDRWVQISMLDLALSMNLQGGIERFTRNLKKKGLLETKNPGKNKPFLKRPTLNGLKALKGIDVELPKEMVEVSRGVLVALIAKPTLMLENNDSMILIAKFEDKKMAKKWFTKVQKKHKSLLTLKP